MPSTLFTQLRPHPKPSYAPQEPALTCPPVLYIAFIPRQHVRLLDLPSHSTCSPLSHTNTKSTAQLLVVRAAHSRSHHALDAPRCSAVDRSHRHHRRPQQTVDDDNSNSIHCRQSHSQTLHIVFHIARTDAACLSCRPSSVLSLTSHSPFRPF